MAAGLAPTPSSENFPDFLKPETFSLGEITVPDQPALVASLGNLGINLGGTQSEDDVVRPQNRPTEVLRVPSEDEAPRALKPSNIADLISPSQAPKLPVPTRDIVQIVTNTEADTSLPYVVGSIVNFDLDAAQLDALAQAELNTMAAWLNANPSAQIGVFGHTDLTGPETYNYALGQNRADQVADYLMKRGVTADRITVVKSYGEAEPMVDTDGISRENRRVQVETIQAL